MADLRDDVESLRKKLNQPDEKINELILEIESMKDSIHELNTVFAKALEDTKEEDPHKAIKILESKMETVLTQNETIAKGMVAISDKLEDFMSKQGSVHPQAKHPKPAVPSPQHTMGAPTMPGARMAPPPEMETPGAGAGMDFPPPPPSAAAKKRGIF